VQRHLLKRTVNLIELFVGSTDDMLLELHKHLSPQLFEAHEDITKEMGLETGHSSNAVGFLSRGFVAATTRCAFAGPKGDETVKCYEVRADTRTECMCTCMCMCMVHVLPLAVSTQRTHCRCAVHTLSVRSATLSARRAHCLCAVHTLTALHSSH
jgi:hypothetical protein